MEVQQVNKTLEAEDSGRAASAAERKPAGKGRDAPDLETLGQVPMTVQVEIGRTVMTLGQLLNEVDPGSIIRLDRHAGELVEVYVNGALFARAEVVLMDDQLGARITELIGNGYDPRPSGLLKAAE